MEPDDLARLKHVGISRKKLLHAHGVTTIRQLHEMPEEALAAIKSIGGHYARLIKSSAECCLLPESCAMLFLDFRGPHDCNLRLR